MAIQKQPVNINFSQGLDLKSDPWQVSPGKFLSLENSIFSKGGQLKKRNGYGLLTSLPNPNSTYLTTFNGDLTAIGTNLQAYAPSLNQWVSKGTIVPVNLSVQTLIRNTANQTQCDNAIASNGAMCTVYTEVTVSSGSPVTVYKYAIADSTTGQNIVSPTLIPVPTGAISGSPRVFLLGSYFIIMFTTDVSGTYDLQYIAISIYAPLNTPIAKTATTVSLGYVPSSTVNFDCISYSNILYIWYNSTSGGQSVKVTSINTQFQQSSTTSFTGQIATIMSACVDSTNPSVPIIYAAYYDSASSTGYVVGVSTSLTQYLAPTEIITTGSIASITCQASNGVVTSIYEVNHNYGYDSAIPTHYIDTITCTSAGVVGSPINILRSVGLASKAFTINSTYYFLCVYSSTYQPTYFLSNTSGNIVAKFAYENGGGYLTLGLPSVTVNGDEAQIPYLYKDLIQAVNKNTNVPSGTQVNGIYSQTGINLANLTLGAELNISTEIGANLNLPGGFVWAYDGYSLTEQNFFVWPDNIELATTTTGGSMTAQQYYYQVVYSWTDNQGNAFRSAPSIPVTITTSGSTSTVTLDIPTLRLTYKTANPVKIEIYRWSAGQEVYYQTTSISTPLLNDPTVDYVTFTDTNSDATILGNSVLYTTGGVVEDVSPPATNSMFLFDDRLWLIDAEDPNLLWYSKQVIENTPVEMSDLFTLYVAPTIGAQGSTGILQCGAAMDDKLILFKDDAIYYINGTGPDNTGANSQYSQPVFITATVGCSNQASIVFTPSGLMFQSDKGIWLLGRDLSTNYIGAPVEDFNSYTVNSAVAVPGTNQVRFTLSNGTTLMYDYYYGQWGTFTNTPAISSTLYQNLHTYLNPYGQILQETPGLYLDGSNPTLMSFTTSWLNLAGLQGYQRAYFFFLIGQYISPHKLNINIAYDYNPSPSQQVLIQPTNFSPAWGGLPLWGSGSAWGGSTSLEQWRVFLSTQKCESLQVSVNEVYDPSMGVAAGAGLTLSGINMVVGLKKGYRPIPALALFSLAIEPSNCPCSP